LPGIFTHLLVKTTKRHIQRHSAGNRPAIQMGLFNEIFKSESEQLQKSQAAAKARGGGGAVQWRVLFAPFYRSRLYPWFSNLQPRAQAFVAAVATVGTVGPILYWSNNIRPVTHRRKLEAETERLVQARGWGNIKTQQAPTTTTTTTATMTEL